MAVAASGSSCRLRSSRLAAAKSTPKANARNKKLADGIVPNATRSIAAAQPEPSIAVFSVF